jgi:argininosuccinate lyase
MSAIWSKRGESSAEWFHRFTTESDRRCDERLVFEDLLVNLAQAVHLFTIGILTETEASAQLNALRQLWTEAETGTPYMLPTDEDIHSASERILAARVGASAGKIHTGRSRNDQVVACVRLWLLRRWPTITERFAQFATSLSDFAYRNKGVLIVGYTHTRPAMPSTADAWAEGFLDVLQGHYQLLQTNIGRFDRCPLGSGAGYGVPLIPLNRELLSGLLGFSEVQQPVTAVQLSRGNDELALIDTMSYVTLLIGRMATDVIAFSDGAEPVFQLSADQTSGSSIMPQKKNPDVWELLRAAASDFQGFRTRLAGIMLNQRSGYHRDLQPVKEILMAATDRFDEVLAVASKAINGISVCSNSAKTDASIFATEAANRLVIENGIPFREAYRNIGVSATSVTIDAFGGFEGYQHTGAPGSFHPAQWNETISVWRHEAAALSQRFKAAEQNLRFRTLQALSAQEFS